MSAKKSWDIAPRAPKKTVRPAAAGTKTVRVQRMADVTPRPADRGRAVRVKSRMRSRIPASVSTKNVTLARATRRRPETRESLKKRRQRARFIVAVVVALLAVVIAGVAIFVAWQPALRVQAVAVQGLHAASVEQIVHETLQGTHAFIVPRNSLFFIPTKDIRARVLAAHPDIESVSITADGFTALSLSTTARSEVLVWCGAHAHAPLPECFSTTAEGLVFAASDPEKETESLRVFAPLADRAEPPFPGAHLMYADRIPETIRFIKALQTLGAAVTTVAFRDDEADLYTRAGTRITYVLGREQQAAAIAASAFPQLSLNDGSVAYVDLRFSGKAYYKRADGSEDMPAVEDSDSVAPEESQEIVESDNAG